MNLSSPLSVTVDFKTSHLLFPTLVSVILALLLLAILVTRWRLILAALTTPPYWPSGIDQPRFFGTIAITVIYFMTMPAVGDLFPNQGYGFLFTSMPFILAMSTLYMHERTRRRLIIAALNAVIAPTVVWYLLSTVFNLTLP